MSDPTKPESTPPTDTPSAETAPPVENAAPAESPPVETGLVMPQLSPERAARRRTRSGRFLGGLVPLVVAGTAIPGALCAALLLKLDEGPASVTPGALASTAQDATAIREALAQSEKEVRALSEPAFQMARIESKRAAYRGAILVEQEARRITQEQQHALALEAALTRQPGLNAKKVPPIAPAVLEPFIKRVGLASPAEAEEGEIVVDEQGNVVGGALPAAFAPVVTALTDGTAEVNGRVAWRAPVPGLPLFVVAVRKLPAAKEPVALAAVSSRLARMERAAAEVPKLVEELAQGRQAVVDDVKETVALSVLASLLCAGLVLLEISRRVVGPLRRLREDAERVRAGARPLPTDVPKALQDIHASLDDIAERLVDARGEDEARAARQAVLDGIIDACARAQSGDLTARPGSGDGAEGMTAIAVAHLMDDVEQRVLRMRSIAANLQGELAACDVSVTGSVPLDARTSLDLIRARLETLNVVPTLLKNVCTRLDALAQHPQATALSDDVKKLSAAVMPRAVALTAVLKEMQDASGRLMTQLSASTAPVAASDALARARNLAQELSRETRAVRVEQSFPALVAAMRDLGTGDIRKAMLATDTPSA